MKNVKSEFLSKRLESKPVNHKDIYFISTLLFWLIFFICNCELIQTTKNSYFNGYFRLALYSWFRCRGKGVNTEHMFNSTFDVWNFENNTATATAVSFSFVMLLCIYNFEEKKKTSLFQSLLSLHMVACMKFRTLSARTTLRLWEHINYLLYFVSLPCRFVPVLIAQVYLCFASIFFGLSILD